MGKNKVKISVIVPIYNAEKTLRKCINSILSQTYTNFELILVNDGSTDSSLKICNKYKKDSRVILINKKNEGSVKARVDGIKKACGEYVTFVDADDWIDKKTFSLLYEEEKKERFDILCFNSYRIIGKYGLIKRAGNKTYFKENKLYDEEKIRNELIEAWLFGHPFPSTLWGKFYKKNIIESTGIYSKGIKFFYDDLMTNFEVFMRAKSIKVIDKNLYYYRYGGGTCRYMPEFFEDVINTYNTQKLIINENYQDNKLSRENGISIMLLNTLKTCIMNIFFSDLNDIEIKKVINKYIKDENILEATINEGSIKYFDSIFLEAIKNGDVDYLYTMGINQYNKTKIKRFILKLLNNIL